MLSPKFSATPSVSETQVNKQHLLVTTSSQVRKPQTMANIGNVIVRTHIITEEYC